MNILESIGQLIEMALRTAFYSIGSFVYQAIIYMYNLFSKLCNGRFLDSELLEAFSERIGLILGLLMLFIVIFSLIKMVLDPDKITDKEMGAASLIKKIVIVIVMLGVSGFVFDSLYTVQKLVIKNNVISKLLLPVQMNEDTSENFGAILSEELLFAFYHLESFEGEVPYEYDRCEKIVTELKNDIIVYQYFSLGKVCLNTTVKDNSTGEDTDAFIIYYNWFFSVAVGIVVLYLLFNYCISVGIRMIQLMFLEIIAPMAIVSYVLPKKDTMFSKWTKMYIGTYIDVFIRIAIINFIVFIIATLFVTDGAGFAVFWDSIGGKPTGWLEHKFILVIIIIALLTFAKKAPDLLKDLFPAGASKLGFGMKSPKQLFDGMLGAKAIKGTANNTVGLLARKTIAGIDAKAHGQSFKDGWKTPKGKFGTWVAKQRESYMPEYNKVLKDRAEGRKEVEQINTKWRKGAEIAKRLNEIAKSNGKDSKYWARALNGENEDYYDIFENERFRKSKMNLDYESEKNKQLKNLREQLSVNGTSVEGLNKIFGNKSVITIGGKDYDRTNINEVIQDLDSSGKALAGLEKVHESMRKQYHNDAMVEDQFKFYKFNKTNPANTEDNHKKRGIEWMSD